MRLKTFESFTKVNEATANYLFNDDVKLEFPEYADEIIDIINQSSGAPEEIEITLEKINKLIGGYGIEVIRSSDSQNKYWIDGVLAYVNMGDTYKPTIMYDINEREFLCTSYGSWIEDNENKYNIE